MYSLSEIFTSIAFSVLVYMLAWFMLAVILKRRDVVDSAWGLGFVLVAWLAYSMRNNESIVTNISFVLVGFWGVRLFAHLTTRNWNKKEDYRYITMGQLGTIKVWLKALTNVFLLQGVLMVIISLPVVAIMAANNTPNDLLVWLWGVVWLFGICFEAVGDYQLRQFIRNKKQGIMQSGLWRYTRHPNYFGEITVWWGAAIVAVAYQQWWGIIGALTITILITKISGVPLLEKRYAKDPDYQKYANRTSKLIPLPPKES